MNGRLEGKTALVTAAGQGIGHATVLAMAREGAHVYATDVKPHLLEQYSGVVNVVTRALDVLDDAAIGRLADELPPLDILFNCAGWVHQGSIAECRPEDWDRSFQLNVRSMFTVCKAMIPKMAAAGGGVTVVVVVCAEGCGCPKGVLRISVGRCPGASVGAVVVVRREAKRSPTSCARFSALPLRTW